MDKHSKIYILAGRALYVTLALMALAAPLSISGTQAAAGASLFFFLVRLVFVRPDPRRDALNLAVMAMVGLTLVSSIFSYEPQVSLRKMVSVSLVLIAYLISETVRDRQMLRRLVVLMLVSAGFTVAYTLVTRAAGKNLKVEQLTADSPLRAIGVEENDTIQKVNGVSVNSPAELAQTVAATIDSASAKIQIYRFEDHKDYFLPLIFVLPATDDAGRFGIVKWTRGRDVRASGFYSHYVTYSEALQLITSLVFGLLIFVPGGFFARNRILLGVVLAAFCAALFFTVTRASWGGLALSATVMVLVGTSRRTILICCLCAVPVVLGAVWFLQQKRNVGFVDSQDTSTAYRTMVWREGFGVLVSSPRHLAVGIGMDSLMKHWQDWHMFGNGYYPLSHLHSTPLMIAFERGVPTLIAWLAWMFFYLQMLWRTLRRPGLSWFERGAVIGAIGGTIGFLASSVVHYNWGDEEVVMIFYIIMGVTMAISRLTETDGEAAVSDEMSGEASQPLTAAAVGQ